MSTTTNIFIGLENQRKVAYDEDKTQGTSRIGQGVTIQNRISEPVSRITNSLASTQSGVSFNQTNYESRGRQGISVRNSVDIDFGCDSPYPDHIYQRYNPVFENNFHGYTEIVNKALYLPFDDINSLEIVHAIDEYINTTDHKLFKFYPNVDTGQDKRYRSIFEFNGVLEPFEIRNIRHDYQKIETKSQASGRSFFRGISADLMGGKYSPSTKGAVEINNYYEIDSGRSGRPSFSVDFFDDAREFTQLISTIHSRPVRESKIETINNDFFDDTVTHNTVTYGGTALNHYSFINDTQIQTLTSKSIKNVSTVGTRHKSGNAGFVYDIGSSSTNLNNFGTDSIAFGGFKR